MLAHRLQRCINIKPALVQRLVFAGVLSQNVLNKLQTEKIEIAYSRDLPQIIIIIKYIIIILSAITFVIP